MKNTLQTAIGAAVLLAIGGAGVLSIAGKSDVRILVEQRAVARYGDVKRELEQQKGESERLQKQGGAAYAYQLCIAARDNLPRKLAELVKENGLSEGGGHTVGDKRVDLSVTGSSVNVLKFLAGVEQSMPEMRARTCTWVGQQDGTVAVTLSWDLWPIPAPAPQKTP